MVQPFREDSVQVGPSRPLPEKPRKKGTFPAVSSRNEKIRRACRALAKAPKSAAALKIAADAIAGTIGDYPTRRSGAKSVCISKRVAALLATYGHALTPALRTMVAQACKGRLRDVTERSSAEREPEFVIDTIVALRLGIAVGDLRTACNDPIERRGFGYPRPHNGRLYFPAAALDPRKARTYLASLPAADPWDQRTWPEGWRS